MSRAARIGLLVVLGVLLGGAGAHATGSTTVVISQVYGGGGITNAVYTNDFVELHNVSNSSVSLSGMSIQYASAAGSTWQTFSLTGTVAAGGYHLIQLASGGSTGIALPAADESGAINMSSTAGKVALVPSTTAITTGIACPMSSAVSVTDFVGYGSTATCFEGSSYASGTTAPTAAVRGDSGCTDTDDNSSDFTATTPIPNNSASPLHFCVADDAPTVTSTTPADAATDVAVDANVDVNFSESVTLDPSWYTISCGSSGSHTATVSGSGSSYTLDPDGDFQTGESCTVTVVASNVSDDDANDPPDFMAADYAFSFTTVAGAATQYLVTSNNYGPAAGSAVTITAQLADADGTAVNEASHQVDWGSTGTGNLSAPTSTTDSSGVATVDLTTSTVAGTVHTVSATDDANNSIAGTSSNITTVPGDVDHITITSSVQDLKSGEARDLTAELRDANENVVSDDNSTEITFAQTSGSGSVTNLGSATAASGVATRQVSGNLVGDVTISATDGTHTDGSTSFNVVPGVADHLSFTTAPADLVSGQNRLLTVEIRDVNENVLTGDSTTSVNFAAGAGPGTVTGLGSSTASAGKATKTVTGKLAGSVTIKATSTGLTDGSTTFTIVPGAAHHLKFTSSTASLASATSRSLTVEIQDANNNKVTSPNVSVAFAKSSGTGTVSGLGSVSSSGGVATKSVTGVLAGSITIKATSTGLTDAVTTFTVVPGAAHHLKFTSSTASLVSNTNRTLTAEVRDVNNNKVTSPARTVTFAKSAGAGTVAGLGSVTSSGGVASKPVKGLKAGSITITASSTGISSAATSFTIVPGVAHHLTFTSSAAGLPLGQSRVLKAEVRDVNNNKVTSPARTVAFAKSAGTGTVSGLPSSVLTSAGVASKSVTATAKGSITIKATSTGLIAGTTIFTIT